MPSWGWTLTSAVNYRAWWPGLTQLVHSDVQMPLRSKVARAPDTRDCADTTSRGSARRDVRDAALDTARVPHFMVLEFGKQIAQMPPESALYVAGGVQHAGHL
jgi:hypothetical protein